MNNTTRAITMHDAADIMVTDLPTPEFCFRKKEETYNTSDDDLVFRNFSSVMNPRTQLYGSRLSANEWSQLGLPVISYWQIECFLEQEVPSSSPTSSCVVVAQNRSSNNNMLLDLFHNWEPGEELVSIIPAYDSPAASTAIMMRYNLNFVELLGYFYAIVFFWSVYLWYKISRRYAKVTRLRRAIVQVVRTDSKLMETLEEIAGFSLKSMTGEPFQLHLLDANAQYREFQNQNYQMLLLRAIYSLPAIKHQVEGKLQKKHSSLSIGYCPPVGLVCLEDLFQSQRKSRRNPLLRILYQVGGACLLGPPCCHALPGWFYIPSSIFFVGSQIWFLVQLHQPEFSECCQCSKTTLEVTEKKKNIVENQTSYNQVNNQKEGEPHDSDSSLLPCCTNCNDTGVCTLECQFCQECLDGEYHMLLDNEELPPDVPADMPLAVPLLNTRKLTRVSSLL